MKHHFGDFLYRDGGHWNFVPNVERYRHRIGDTAEGDPEVKLLTFGKDEDNWRRALTLPNLEELTLHEPSPDQLRGVGALRSLRRLRITHARPKDIEFIASMTALEEVILEYVSGFSDLSPLARLPRLRSLYLENLRRVSSFGCLAGANHLEYLGVRGTLDWNQPIDDFEFLRGTPRLEYLGFSFIKCKAPFPAALPFAGLRELERLHLIWNELATAEYALIEECLPGIEGARWGAFSRFAPTYLDLPKSDPRHDLPLAELQAKHPEVLAHPGAPRRIPDPNDEWFEFTGRGAGRVKCISANAAAKCAEKTAAYEVLKRRAREILSTDVESGRR
jgi:hypothetical protein